jgi:uncharacterized pyridoxal phosphate-containing UPF0001 family protein
MESNELVQLQNIKIVGLMGMATNTEDSYQIRTEFKSLKTFFDEVKNHSTTNFQLSILSMGMSSDYLMAIEEGSTIVRVGSSIFGRRNYL